MEKFKGTPGPWFVSPKKNIEVTGDMNVIQTHGSNCLGFHIAYASGWTDNESTRTEASNNARLIAAAPELLKALQKLRVYAEDVCGVCPDDCHEEHPLMLATSAINKALGK